MFYKRPVKDGQVLWSIDPQKLLHALAKIKKKFDDEVAAYELIDSSIPNNGRIRIMWSQICEVECMQVFINGVIHKCIQVSFPSKRACDWWLSHCWLITTCVLIVPSINCCLVWIILLGFKQLITPPTSGFVTTSSFNTNISSLSQTL